MSSTSESVPTATRRQVMVGGALASAGLLAACSSSSSGGAAATSAPAPATSTPAASPTATPTSGGGGAVLGPTSKVPVGGGAIFEAGDQKIVVTQPSAGVYEGFSAVCPHEGCNVSEVTDGLMICPCHGSTFAVTDGTVQKGPARGGLAPVEVKVEGSDVVLV